VEIEERRRIVHIYRWRILTTTTVLCKSATKRTEKPVVPPSKCLTKSSDDEEDDDAETLLPKSIAKDIRLTPKLDLLRSRTVGAGAKELASNSHKSSTSS
jgi:hypothetical protein